MATNCIGCGKPIGGVFGAYSVKLLYGEVCLTCNKKLKVVPSYQYLTPVQIKDIINHKVDPRDVQAPNFFVQPEQLMNPGHSSAQPSDAHAKQSAPDEIRKYKQLYDEGIISKEEFEAVKKKLMGV